MTYPTVFGIGLPRTGTQSLIQALEMLGYDRVLDLQKATSNSTVSTEWLNLAQFWPKPAVRTLIAGHDAAVGIPASYFWRDLEFQFPEAKFVLTVRDVDEWWASFSQTVGALERQIRDTGDRESILATTLMFEKTFHGQAADETFAKMIYQDHIMEVINVLPKWKLLVLEFGQGFAPLCEFLGKELMCADYPHVNHRETYRKMHRMNVIA